MIVEGRSDDQTWAGIPLKNICRAETRVCVGSVFFAVSLFNALFPFSLLSFSQISPFITLSGYPPMLCFPLAYHFIACSVFNPVKKSEWSRWCASHIDKVWSIILWSSSPSQHFPALIGAFFGVKIEMHAEGKETDHDLRCQREGTGVCVFAVLIFTTTPFQSESNTSHIALLGLLLQLNLPYFVSHTRLLLCLCIAHFVSQPQANLPNTWKIKICEQA